MCVAFQSFHCNLPTLCVQATQSIVQFLACRCLLRPPEPLRIPFFLVEVSQMVMLMTGGLGCRVHNGGGKDGWQTRIVYDASCCRSRSGQHGFDHANQRRPANGHTIRAALGSQISSRMRIVSSLWQFDRTNNVLFSNLAWKHDDRVAMIFVAIMSPTDTFPEQLHVPHWRQRRCVCWRCHVQLWPKQGSIFDAKLCSVGRCWYFSNQFAVHLSVQGLRQKWMRFKMPLNSSISIPRSQPFIFFVNFYFCCRYYPWQLHLLKVVASSAFLCWAHALNLFSEILHELTLFFQTGATVGSKMVRQFRFCLASVLSQCWKQTIVIL